MNRTAIPLRVLFVEDSENDTRLELQLLKRNGYDVEHARVETAEAMRAALRSSAWDIVLCDHGLPGFDALGALEVRQACAPDLPFIIVSGIIGEELAVSAMKAGAADYVIKGRLDRLAPAVQKALNDALARHERRRTEEALPGSESRYRALVELSADWYWEQDENYRFVRVEPGSPAVESIHQTAHQALFADAPLLALLESLRRVEASFDHQAADTTSLIKAVRYRALYLTPTKSL